MGLKIPKDKFKLGLYWDVGKVRSQGATPNRLIEACCPVLFFRCNGVPRTLYSKQISVGAAPVELLGWTVAEPASLAWPGLAAIPQREGC